MSVSVSLKLSELSYIFSYRMRTNSWLAIFAVSEIWTKDSQPTIQE